MPVKVAAAKLTVKAHVGDQKTLLAFDFPDKARIQRLAGFTIACQPAGQTVYFLHNLLRFADPTAHAQDPKEPATSSVNAPFQKFRWLHVPGSIHQGSQPGYGDYLYTVTPRYFDDKGSMLPIDSTLGVTVSVPVGPFAAGALQVAFTRGFVQSQAYVNRFGPKAVIQPASKRFDFDTAVGAGTDPTGNKFTFRDEYSWLGFSAREKIFALLNEVAADPSLHIDMFAYDLNEPDIIGLLLPLAKSGRLRLILDDSPEHHSSAAPKPEDQVEALFGKSATSRSAMRRGHFQRYSHDKVMVVSKGGKAVRVLTGSTNFSITGLYVNSNHVLVIEDATVAETYAGLFEAVWNSWESNPKSKKGGVIPLATFLKQPFSGKHYQFGGPGLPSMDVTFAPHSSNVTNEILDGISQRIAVEGRAKGGSVFFAVMGIASGGGSVYPALRKLHAQSAIYTYGISDAPGGIALYAPGHKTGVLVTGKPGNTRLPKPFSQVPGVGSGHQVHHKFVVCGFNGPDPVVYCGSSNLSAGGEESNGDNLLAIRDAKVAAAFMIEAVGLVDHFAFLDRSGAVKKKSAPPASKQKAAEAAGWYLAASDKWAGSYFLTTDLHFADRQLFAK